MRLPWVVLGHTEVLPQAGWRGGLQARHEFTGDPVWLRVVSGALLIQQKTDIKTDQAAALGLIIQYGAGRLLM